MNIEKLRYQNAEKSGVVGTIDGKSAAWPLGHPDLKGRNIADFVPPVPDAGEVKDKREADLLRPGVIAAIVGWIEANPGTMTPAMQAVIDKGKA